jgi:hypothetical protein
MVPTLLAHDKYRGYGVWARVFDRIAGFYRIYSNLSSEIL